MALTMIIQRISCTFRFVTKMMFYASLVVMFLVLFPGLPPYISFKSFKVTPSVKLEGRLAPNYVLDQATKFIDGDFSIKGAESIVIKNNILYTGVKGGRLLRLEDKDNGMELINIAATGKPCKINKDLTCGIPMGIRVDTKGNLILADAYNGIAKVDSWSGNVQYYFSTDAPIEGEVSNHPNDLDVAKDGTVYWSEFSSEYKLENKFLLERIGDSSGRLIKFNPKTKDNTIILSGLYGANGVQLSKNEEFVLVSEFYKYRVSRFYLKGPKAGTSDVFVDGLPGAPDNIRPNGRGGYYIALYMPRVPMSDLGRLPQLRKLLFRIRWFALATLALYDKLKIQNSYLDLIKDYVENFGGLGFIQNGRSSIVEIDAEGEILQVLQTNETTMNGISQITVGKSYAYMGGPNIEEIWKINVNQLQNQQN